MRVRTWLVVILLVFASAPSQAQRPTSSPATSAIKRFVKLVPRLLGDHLSPPKPTDTMTKCSGTSCK